MAFVGSCEDMCPLKERQNRFGLYMSIFEKDKNNQPDQYAMVKEYRRSGADQEEPSSDDLRTVGALELTMNYLIARIMDDPRSMQADLAIEWYDFLWDRLRAIRKDITQQNICDQRTALLVERCARFHVHSCYALNRIKDFDVELNRRNLNDCLQMLRQIYTDLRALTGNNCPGELEFQKYDILLHLNDDQLSSTLLMKTSDHRSHPEMMHITKIFSAYTNNDYFRFFQLMERSDYMTSCILSLYANKMRVTGLKVITHACSSVRQTTLYPSESIIYILGFDGMDDLKIFLDLIGIELQSKDGKEYLTLSRELVSTIRRTEQNLPPFKSYRMVESKMENRSVGHLVYGDVNDSEIDYMDHDMNCIPSNNLVEQPLQTNTMQNVQSKFDRSIISQPTPIQPRSPYQAIYTNRDQDVSARAPHPNLAETVSKPSITQVDHVSQIPSVPRISPTAIVKTAKTVPTQAESNMPMVPVNFSPTITFSPTVPSRSAVQELESIVQTTASPSPPPSPPPPLALEPEFDWADTFLKKPPMKTREELADLMPAGHFKIVPLASKRPKLVVPESFRQQVETTPKRKKTSLGARQTLESFEAKIKDEKKMNQIFQELTTMISQ